MSTSTTSPSPVAVARDTVRAAQSEMRQATQDAAQQKRAIDAQLREALGSQLQLVIALRRKYLKLASLALSFTTSSALATLVAIEDGTETSQVEIDRYTRIVAEALTAMVGSTR